MGQLRVFMACVLGVVLLIAKVPAEAAPTYHVRHTAPYNTDENFDGQAYYASRYVPALRPKVVVGTLLLIGVIVVILQNSNNHGHIHS